MCPIIDFINHNGSIQVGFIERLIFSVGAGAGHRLACTWRTSSSLHSKAPLCIMNLAFGADLPPD